MFEIRALKGTRGSSGVIVVPPVMNKVLGACLHDLPVGTKATLLLGSEFPIRPSTAGLSAYLEAIDFLQGGHRVLFPAHYKEALIKAQCRRGTALEAYTSIEKALKAHARKSVVICAGLADEEQVALLACSRSGGTIEAFEHSPFDFLRANRARTTAYLPAPVSAALYDLEAERFLIAFRPHVGHPPASITKLVTLAAVEDKLKQLGMAARSVQVSVSERAAAEASAWGIPAGALLSVHDLMRAAAIVSSNEAANALAEWHSGTGKDFVWHINAMARDMGLMSTHFASPCGLGRTQTTNVIDMVKLGRHICTDYESLFDIFCERSFSYAGKEKPATNRLLEVVPGSDGMKIGTLSGICWNLLFSFKKPSKSEGRYIAVVLGAPSKKARDDIVLSMVAAAGSVMCNPRRS